MTQDPEYGVPSGQDPEYPMDADAGQDAGEDTAQDERIDTGTENSDLHGQAAEVADSASGPGPAETPAG